MGLVAIQNYTSEHSMFPIKNALKEGVLLSLLFNFALKYAIWKVKANHKLLKFNGTRQVTISADDVNLRGQSTHHKLHQPIVRKMV